MSFSIMQRLKAQREAAARKREKKKLEVKEKKSAEATTDGRKETKGRPSPTSKIQFLPTSKPVESEGWA
eukprot:893181-Amorphochlora_amoeboformis.AAC.1